jgi:hypothetical protein
MTKRRDSLFDLTKGLRHARRDRFCLPTPIRRRVVSRPPRPDRTYLRQAESAQALRFRDPLAAVAAEAGTYAPRFLAPPASL